MKSSIVKRSIVIAGHKTSVSLEDPFWLGLKEIAHELHKPLPDLLGMIESNRHTGNLSSAIRLFVLETFRSQRASVVSASVVPASLAPQDSMAQDAAAVS